MLTLTEFANLNLSQQFFYIKEIGKYKTTRQLDQYCINLYSIGDFYAEVWFEPRKNSLYLISSFSTDSIESINNQVTIDNRMVA